MSVKNCSLNCKIMNSYTSSEIKNHSINLSSSRETTNTQVQEESGWTTYLEDFQKTEHSTSQFSNSTPSMVSDAATYAAWNNISDRKNTNNEENCGTFLHPSEFPKKLNFNKSSKFKNKRFSYNEELEDTASSPVNSPKVSCGRQQVVSNQRRQNDVQNNFMGMEYEESKMSNLEHSELRKKGLCLVPVSMLINHAFS